MAAFHYHNLVNVPKGMTWWNAAQKLAFDNPGPLLNYPPNSDRFITSVDPMAEIPTYLGQLFVPYKRESLDRMIAAAQDAILDVNRRAAELIAMVKVDGDKVNQVFATADIAAMLLNALAGVGLAASTSVKTANAATATAADVMSEEAVMAMLKEGLPSRAANVITTLVPTPDPAQGSGVGHYAKLIIRHTLGPWNPSFWASVALAIKEDNADIYIYGPDAWTAQQTRKIANQANNTAKDLMAQVNDMKEQRKAGFYDAKV
jgi:hypothetical protein